MKKLLEKLKHSNVKELGEDAGILHSLGVACPTRVSGVKSVTDCAYKFDQNNPGNNVNRRDLDYGATGHYLQRTSTKTLKREGRR